MSLQAGFQNMSVLCNAVMDLKVRGCGVGRVVVGTCVHHRHALLLRRLKLRGAPASTRRTRFCPPPPSSTFQSAPSRSKSLSKFLLPYKPTLWRMLLLRRSSALRRSTSHFAHQTKAMSGNNAVVQMDSRQHVCVMGRRQRMVSRHPHSYIHVAAAAAHH